MKRKDYLKPEIKAYEMEAATILSGSTTVRINEAPSYEDACSNKGFFDEEEEEY